MKINETSGFYRYATQLSTQAKKQRSVVDISRIFSRTTSASSLNDRELTSLQTEGNALVGELNFVDSLDELEAIEGMLKEARAAAELKGEPTTGHFDAALTVIGERKKTLQALFPTPQHIKSGGAELLKGEVVAAVKASAKKPIKEQQDGNFGAAGLEATLNEDAAVAEDSGVSDDAASTSSAGSVDEGINETFRTDVLGGRSNVRFEMEGTPPIDLKTGDTKAGTKVLDAIRGFTKHPKGRLGLQLLLTQKGLNGGASGIMNGNTNLVPASDSQHLFQLKRTADKKIHVLIRSAFMVRDMANPEEQVEVPTQTVVEFDLSVEKDSQEFRVRSYELRTEFPT